MKLRIGFSTTNSFISKIIRWFINAPVSHTYIRYYDEFLKDEYVAHADWNGVVQVQATQFEKQNVVVAEFEIDDERLLESLRRNLKFLGRKYDYWNLVGWAWIITFKRWAKIKINHPIDDPKKLICVELCVRILNNAQITALPHGMHNPKSLYEWFVENYEKMGWKIFTK